MRHYLRLGLMAAVVCLIGAASVLPAHAQRHRGGSGGGPTVQAVHGGSTVGTAVPRGYDAQARPGGGPPQGGGQAHGGPPPGGQPGHGPGGGPVYGPGGGYGHGHGGGYPAYGWGAYWAFGGYYGPYYWSPWFYSPYWYDPFWYGGYYAPYGYGWGGMYNGANLKIQVQPKTAEVYVDGRMAGIVDEFDGMFQSLMVEAGGHDVAIYLDGYRTIHEHLYLNVGSTYKIKGVMQPLAPGEAPEPRPQASAPVGQAGYGRQRPVQAGPEPPDNYPPPTANYPPPSAPEPRAAEPPQTQVQVVPGDAKFGQVAVRVQPTDAEVLIDGEVWHTPSGADRLVVHLSPGTHRVEIRKAGFDSFVTAVDIKRGETAVLNVSLTRF